jgi:glycolate oxidase FAD binding subunit
MAYATRERLMTVIRGGGTKIDWGRPPAAIDLMVSTHQLNRLVAHRHGDLTATVQPGLRLADLNAALRVHRQWLPVESAFDAATVGGIVATNDSGPSRHRNGTPRDLVIGMTLALTDGRLVKTGGTVVKNVAGYDLGKLVSGSHGTLAAIADVTFKLVPMPHASSTLVTTYTDDRALARDVNVVAASQLEPAAFDIRVDDGARSGGPLTVLVRFGTSPAATDAQIAAARALMSGASTVLTGAAEWDAWNAHIRAPWSGDGAVVRLSWLPARLADVLALVSELTRITGARVVFVGRAGGGGTIRVEGPVGAQIDSVSRLRKSPHLGHVVVLRASGELKRAVDVWGSPRDSEPVARALKQMFDPAGILNAARGPIL